ncbi:NAD-dependent epimerase/dehydratase family protein [bacterium]|nr:NAD-dependent epimerase/dehydratase family protein [bacterium]
MQYVLVTGSNGFIGSHLVQRLVAEGITVRCLVRKTSDLRWLEGLDIELVYGDLRDYDSLEEVVSKVDTVFHCASQTGYADNESYYQTNVMGTVNLLKAIAYHNPYIKRFIYLSSQAASGPSYDGHPISEADSPDPITSYGASKLAAEEAALAFEPQIPVTVIRPPLVFGPRDKNLFLLFKIIRKKIKPVLGWRKRHLSLIFIDDLIEGLLLAVKCKKATGQTYFITSESQYTYQDLNKIIASIMGQRAITVHIPVLLFTGIILITDLISKITGKSMVLNKQRMQIIKQRYWICDGSKAVKELGFRSDFSLEEGIRKSIAWYRENGWL